MRVVFAGTPAFAERALDAMLAAGHQVVGVLTRPDRPAGRGQTLTPSPSVTRPMTSALSATNAVSATSGMCSSSW